MVGLAEQLLVVVGVVQLPQGKRGRLLQQLGRMVVLVLRRKAVLPGYQITAETAHRGNPVNQSGFALLRLVLTGQALVVVVQQVMGVMAASEVVVGVELQREVIRGAAVLAVGQVGQVELLMLALVAALEVMPVKLVWLVMAAGEALMDLLAELVQSFSTGQKGTDMKHARIINNQAIDVRTESPEGCFTPNIVAEFQAVPDEVHDNWTVSGGVWSAPPVPVPHVPTAEELAAAATAANNARLLAEIAALELTITVRMQREALIGKAATDPRPGPHQGKTAKQIIQSIDDAIVELRGQLK